MSKKVCFFFTLGHYILYKIFFKKVLNIIIKKINKKILKKMIKNSAFFYKIYITII